MERFVRELDTKKETRELAWGITSVPRGRGGPKELLQWNRGHWCIENRVHWVRDVTFDEDRCRVRRGGAAQALAGLRNLAIGLLRLAGAKYIAPALRHCSWHLEKVLRLLGISLRG